MKFELDEYCPCCHYNTLKKKERLDYAICPVCFWEDDPEALEDPEFVGSSNRVSLRKARENFRTFGACEKSMVKNVRRPRLLENQKNNAA